MNLAPSGTMSCSDSGARLIAPLSPNPAPFLVRLSDAPSVRGRADVAGADCVVSFSSIVLALASMIGGSRPVRAMPPVVRDLTAKHALKEHGGLDELARPREACGFANDVLFQHLLHRVLSARAALTAGLACKAPSTATEAIVARASSGVTS